jgi:hypothetical protein
MDTGEARSDPTSSNRPNARVLQQIRLSLEDIEQRMPRPSKPEAFSAKNFGLGLLIFR